MQPVEFAGAHGIEQRRALHQLVAAQGEQPALRHAAHGVVGAADALQEGGDRARRRELAHQLHIADVDAELERGRGDQRAQRAGLEALLRVQALFARQAAVVGGDVVRADPLAQVARDALDHAPGVGEYQRGVVLADQRGDLVVEGLPDFVGHHRLERRVRQHQRQIAHAACGRCRRPRRHPQDR